MRYYQSEVGCVYDTLFFLSRFLSESVGMENEEAPRDSLHCLELKNRISEQNISIPHVLYPLTVRYQGLPSFMDIVLFQERAYDECSLRHIDSILSNQNYLYRRYCEHFFPQHDMRNINSMIGTYPHGLEMIKSYRLPPQLEFYIFYATVHFEKVTEALKKAFLSVYVEIEKEHTAFLSENPDFTAGLSMDTLQMEKLRAISGVQDEGEFPFRFSLSLMEPELIQPNNREPASYILGCAFEKVLDERYRYAGLTPYTFALAIGSAARYEIYQALMKKSVMSRTELEKELRMSRSEIEYNLNSMREKGLVEVARRQGNTNYYKINPEFIRVVANTLLEDIQLRA